MPDVIWYALCITTKEVAYIGKQRDDLDWNAVRVEYITTNTSYTELAKKYKVSRTQLGDIAKEEDWTGQRQKHRDDVLMRTIKTIEKNKSERMVKLFDLTDIVLETLTSAFSGKEGGTNKKAILSDPKKFTGAIKDIKEIYMIRSSADLDEQQARIEKLKKDVEVVETNDSNTIEVVFSTEEDEWAK